MLVNQLQIQHPKADTFGVTLPPLVSNGAGTKSVANQIDNKLGRK